MHCVQCLLDFPEALLMDISRPGDERSYMRPIVESAEIIQQPYLGMLNPHIDEIMFEPMEGKSIVISSLLTYVVEELK